MKVISGGCSFIFGNELADQVSVNHSNSVIPALLAKSIDAEYITTARAGNANNAITRQVIAECERQKHEDIFVFVLWTFTHRYEFRFNYPVGRRDSPWYSINLWDIAEDPKSIKNEFHNYDEHVFNSHLNNKMLMDSTGLTNFAKTFYRHVGNNEYYETYTTLKEILFLQQYLTLNNIPFMFVPADMFLKDSDTYLRHAHDANMSSLCNQIDWDKWFTFPAGTRPNETCVSRGFYQWAVENKYPVGTTHPLEQAHQDAANLMQEKFNEMVKKSV
jgi:hypothetical protein